MPALVRWLLPASQFSSLAVTDSAVNPEKRRIVLLGPPASGKGTQADRLSKAFGIPHVSTGALLRSECTRGTPLGLEADTWTRRGLLVPDELAVRVVTTWIAAHGTRFLFDGFPRTVTQARHLDKELEGMKAPLDLIILLELGDQEIRRRILDRISCLACGATFASTLQCCGDGDPCPRCGNLLVRRNDDTVEALEQRLSSYRDLTIPVIDYYQQTLPTFLHRVNAAEGSEVIFAKLSALVADRKDEG